MNHTALNPEPLHAPETHEHGWRTESRHATSSGAILYVRCDACGARRVDLEERAGIPPQAVSHEVHPGEVGKTGISSSGSLAAAPPGARPSVGA